MIKSFLAAHRLREFPDMIRTAIKYFMPELAEIFEHSALAKELIVTILNDRAKNQHESPDLRGRARWNRSQLRSQSAYEYLIENLFFLIIISN